jgi:S1-C subfamily serine protease
MQLMQGPLCSHCIGVCRTLAMLSIAAGCHQLPDGAIAPPPAAGSELTNPAPAAVLMPPRQSIVDVAAKVTGSVVGVSTEKEKVGQADSPEMSPSFSDPLFDRLGRGLRQAPDRSEQSLGSGVSVSVDSLKTNTDSSHVRNLLVGAASCGGLLLACQRSARKSGQKSPGGACNAFCPCTA